MLSLVLGVFGWFVFKFEVLSISTLNSVPVLSTFNLIELNKMS